MTLIKMRTYLISVFALCAISAAHGKDAELAHETFMRSIKMGGMYGQTAYKKQEYSFATATSVQNEYNVAYYGPTLGGGLYIAPMSFFHLNVGGDVSFTFSDAPIQASSSKTSISASFYGNLGIRLGDLWPFAGLSYQLLALDPRYVLAQGGVEYRSGNWVFGGLLAKSVSASQESGAAYSEQRNWYTQVYATWLWGRWY